MQVTERKLAVLEAEGDNLLREIGRLEADLEAATELVKQNPSSREMEISRSVLFRQHNQVRNKMMRAKQFIGEWRVYIMALKSAYDAFNLEIRLLSSGGGNLNV